MCERVDVCVCVFVLLDVISGGRVGRKSLLQKS